MSRCVFQWEIADLQTNRTAKSIMRSIGYAVNGCVKLQIEVQYDAAGAAALSYRSVYFVHLNCGHLVMVSNIAQLSVAKLEQVLNKRKATLEVLLSRRGKIQRALKKVEQRIVLLEGRSGAPSGKKSRRKRPRNAASLPMVITEILSKAKNGLPLGELSDRILASGYKSSSANFKNVLYQSLYHASSIEHDSKIGHYRLKQTKKSRG